MNSQSGLWSSEGWVGDWSGECGHGCFFCDVCVFSGSWRKKRSRSSFFLFILLSYGLLQHRGFEGINGTAKAGLASWLAAWLVSGLHVRCSVLLLLHDRYRSARR